jgi:threonine synthase
MAGGAQITKIAKAFSELIATGLVDAKPVKVFGAQAQGCSPIATAMLDATSEITPQLPDTICKSLAIGNPADGYHALEAIRSSGGWCESATDPEIVSAMRLLAEREGVFGETAAGVTVAVAEKLIDQGRIGPRETTVICITGNGLKTTDALVGAITDTPVMAPKLAAFEEQLVAVGALR